MTRFGLLSALAAVSVFAMFAYAVRWNHTPSVPVGLYVISRSGRFAEFCPAEPWAELSRVRNYRPAGRCADGREPLVKRIVAGEGDTVFFSTLGVAVNGVVLPNSQAQVSDSAGRVMLPFPYGRYVLGSNRYWVMGDDPRSFDSRYYGPVDTSQIRAMLRPLFPWGVR